MSQRKQATILFDLDLFLCWFVYCVSYYGRLDACAALCTNQMGYIIVIARLPRIYGNVKLPSDLGRFTVINPWPHAITIMCTLVVICILSMVGATALRVAAVFGPGTGRVWVNRPLCTLNDTSFSNCSFGIAVGTTTGCGHANDAGVICYTQFGMYMHVCM